MPDVYLSVVAICLIRYLSPEIVQLQNLSQTKNAKFTKFGHGNHREQRREPTHLAIKSGLPIYILENISFNGSSNTDGWDHLKELPSFNNGSLSSNSAPAIPGLTKRHPLHIRTTRNAEHVTCSNVIIQSSTAHYSAPNNSWPSEKSIGGSIIQSQTSNRTTWPVFNQSQNSSKFRRGSTILWCTVI